jgi:hypothetical protein
MQEHSVVEIAGPIRGVRKVAMYTSRLGGGSSQAHSVCLGPRAQRIGITQR